LITVEESHYFATLSKVLSGSLDLLVPLAEPDLGCIRKGRLTSGISSAQSQALGGLVRLAMAVFFSEMRF
jgi:hypothetical protein